MERELARDRAGFVQQVFCAGEAAYCAARRQPAQHFAARFAAKEAVFKALALELEDMSAWREVEILSGGGGAGQVVFHGRLRDLAARRGVRHVRLSMSHTPALAAASVILET